MGFKVCSGLRRLRRFACLSPTVTRFHPILTYTDFSVRNCLPSIRILLGFRPSLIISIRLTVANLIQTCGEPFGRCSLLVANQVGGTHLQPTHNQLRQIFHLGVRVAFPILLDRCLWNYICCDRTIPLRLRLNTVGFNDSLIII